MNEAERILALHRRVAALKGQVRRGWVQRGVDRPESVADHSLGVAVLAAALAPDLGVDRGELVTMAALHDLCEAVCGDVTPADGVAPEEKLSREAAAMAQVLEGLPDAEELLERWLDMAEGRTAMGRLVKELDALEMVLQAEHYEGQQAVDLAEFHAAGRALQTPQLVRINAALEQRRARRTLLAHLCPADAPRPAELIIGFGVFHMSVPAHCARLYRDGAAPRILFTGGVGAGSGDLDRPEAQAFREHALSLGVPAEAILTEEDSTHTLENVLRSRDLLTALGPLPTSALMVALPHRQRRVWLTCRRHLPGVELINAPPPADLDEQEALLGGPDAYARHMLGELDRIERYGARGDIAEDSPGEAIQAARALLQRQARTD